MLEFQPYKVFMVWYKNGDETPVLDIWRVWSDHFIAITPRSTLIQSDSTC